MLALLGHVVPPTGRVIASIADDQWSMPTPCQKLTVHELAAHLVGGLEQFGDVAAGLPMDVTAKTEIEPDEVSARFDAAAGRMLELWSAPGVADVVYPMPWGDTPGANLIGFMVIEVATHGWDLARATDQDPGVDDALAGSVLELAEHFDDPSIRVPPMFAPIVPAAEGASGVDRLAAFLGRDPRKWTAS